MPSKRASCASSGEADLLWQHLRWEIQNTHYGCSCNCRTPFLGLHPKAGISKVLHLESLKLLDALLLHMWVGGVLDKSCQNGFLMDRSDKHPEELAQGFWEVCA